jgi:hypothetical protein
MKVSDMVTLSPNARKALTSRGYETMDQVIAIKDEELLSFDGIADASVAEIRKWEFYTRRDLMDDLTPSELSEQTSSLAYEAALAMVQKNGKCFEDYGKMAWQMARQWYASAVEG